MILRWGAFLVLGAIAGARVAVAAPLAATAVAGGTLIAMVPSQAGLVIAADSRATMDSTQCDNEVKLVIPARPARTIVAVTGNGKFFRAADIAPSHLCDDLQRAHPILDIGAIIKEALEAGAGDLEHLSIEALSATCLDRVTAFERAWPTALKPFADREVFSVVLAAYDPKTRTALIRNFVVAIAPESLTPRIARQEDFRFTAQNRQTDRVFGEGAYFDRSVVHGPGREFFSPRTERFIAARATIAETPLEEAVDVATNLVEAAAKTTELVPAPSGIGGPIDVVLLGDASQPRLIKWKGR